MAANTRTAGVLGFGRPVSARFARRWAVSAGVLFSAVAAHSVCFAQSQPLCVPGTPFCVQANGAGGVKAGGSAQGQAGPNGATGSATGNANANANANANVNANANANASGSASGSGTGSAGGSGQGNAGGAATGGGVVQGDGSGSAGGAGSATADGDGNAGYGGQGQGGYWGAPARSYSKPIRWGTGLAFCGTVKAGVFSGVKGGGCFAVSFRFEPLTFEMETQLLYGGVRESIDWVFPMSFMIPLTEERSLYEGLHLRVGGSPIGVTFAKEQNGGSYLRFGLHAGVSYEWDVSDVASWRVFDARAFLDFGTKREVDRRGNFLDFGGQLSSGIVF